MNTPIDLSELYDKFSEIKNGRKTLSKENFVNAISEYNERLGLTGVVMQPTRIQRLKSYLRSLDSFT